MVGTTRLARRTRAAAERTLVVTEPQRVIMWLLQTGQWEHAPVTRRVTGRYMGRDISITRDYWRFLHTQDITIEMARLALRALQ